MAAKGTATLWPLICHKDTKMTEKGAGWWDAIRRSVQGWFGTATPPVQSDTRVENHFKEPDWGQFDKHLDNQDFRIAVRRDPRTDAKLKRFVNVQASIRTNPTDGMKVLSSGGAVSYNVKYDKRIGRYTCTCNDFKYTKFNSPTGECKHIQKVKADGGLKMATAQAFGDEYARVIEKNPALSFRVDSAHVRKLREDRKDLDPTGWINGRLRNSSDEPVYPALIGGGSPSQGSQQFEGDNDED